MKKVILTGSHLQDVEPALAAANLEVVDANPDVVVTHGGDGALLNAERLYPGVPKFPMRDNRGSPLCPSHGIAKRLGNLAGGHYSVDKLPKLLGLFNDRQVCGINDVFIHNIRRVNAIRYRVWIDGKLYAREIVGDGVGVSTQHGSTAYYRSITHSVFRVGIGLSFSNSTELINHLVLPEPTVVRVRVIRGPGAMVADNFEDNLVMDNGDEAEIRLGDTTATVYDLDQFMCHECRRLRHTKK